MGKREQKACGWAPRRPPPAEARYSGDSLDEEEPIAEIWAAIAGLQPTEKQDPRKRGQGVRSKISKGKSAAAVPSLVALLSRIAGKGVRTATETTLEGAAAGEPANSVVAGSEVTREYATDDIRGL